MVIKVDLEKAYDKLEWSFIGEMLFRVNLPSNLIQLIMSCVTSVSTSILFHGKFWIVSILQEALSRVILCPLTFL